MIHNINACTTEELEELGFAPIATGDVTGNTEPFFVDGEPRDGVQPIGDEQDCGSIFAGQSTSPLMARQGAPLSTFLRMVGKDRRRVSHPKSCPPLN